MNNTNTIKFDDNGSVSISSSAFTHPQVQQWLEPFKIKQVKGNMHYCPHNETLQFEPLRLHKHPPKVKAKTHIAHSQVALYKDMIKISTSLPLSMSKAEMDLTLQEENYLVERAFMLGLCRALVIDSMNKEEESNATI